MSEIFKRISNNPGLYLVYFLGRIFQRSLWADKIYLKIMYWYRFNKRLNLKNPQTYNEKLQWLKLYDRNQKYTQIVDKYEVRKYISEKLGDEYLIPLIGV